MNNHYSIEIAPAARRQLRRMTPDAQRQLQREIDALELDPRPSGVVKLSGPDNLYRVRTGDYRIIYRIEDAVLQVLVIKIGHRREVYK